MVWDRLKSMFKKTAGVDWIVVFLGNPGEKYKNTRHNAGFMAAEAVEARTEARIDRLKFKALTGMAQVGQKRLFLMKPQTYMNLSGQAVREAMAFYKVPLERVLVVSDDVTLPLGKLRIRREGSAGGHNGLKDIIARCGGEGFPRIKIGVGSPENGADLVDWVLMPFSQAEMTGMRDAARRAAEAVEVIVQEGIDKAMNRFN